MLRRMTAKTFRDWEIYFELEPFDEIRADLRAASIVAAIYNVNRGPKTKPFTLEDVVLKFGDSGKPEKPKQTWQEQLAIVKALAAMHANDKPPGGTT